MLEISAPDISREKPREALKSGTIVLGLFLLILCWIGLPLIAIWLYGKPKTASELGGIFVIVNALFSGLAFAGLLVTIKLQMSQMHHSQAELRQSADALREQAILNSITARLGTLPALIREQRVLLGELEGIFKDRSLTVSQITTELAQRESGGSRTILDHDDNLNVISILNHLKYLLVEQQRLFKQLTHYESGHPNE